jgi:hypothetical protein
MSRIHRLTTVVGTALLVAGLAAGPAVAQSGDVRSPDARDAGTPAVVQSGDVRSPDARDAGTPAVRAPSAQPAAHDVRSPDARDAADGGTPVVVQVHEAPSTGVRWDSAAVGALIAAGLLVALAGVMTLVSRRRTPRKPRPAL